VESRHFESRVKKMDVDSGDDGRDGRADMGGMRRMSKRMIRIGLEE